jgi:hypothetical protein
MTQHLLKQGDCSGQPPGNGIERIEENDFLEVDAAGNDPFCTQGTIWNLDFEDAVMASQAL